MWIRDKCECNAECEYECMCDWAVVPTKWQSLTDDEIDKIMDGEICQSYYEMLGYARAIEQTLKEKNYGNCLG